VFGITESLSGELPSPVRQKKVPAKTGLSAKQGQVQNRWAGLDIDTLLLSALDAHNASDFKTAIAIYTEILSRKP